MSLILEALRKLEKEKQAPERGFLVVAASAWPATRRHVAPGAIAIGTLAVVAIGLAAWLWPHWSRHAGNEAGALPPAPPTTALQATLPSPAPAAIPVPTTPPSLPRLASPEVALRPSRPPRASATPGATTEPSPPALVLEAISQRDGRPIALVSGHLVREGDAFDGVTIVRIGEAEVEVEWQGQRQVLRF
jgi:hypothetical protein